MGTWAVAQLCVRGEQYDKVYEQLNVLRDLSRDTPLVK